MKDITTEMVERARFFEEKTHELQIELQTSEYSSYMADKELETARQERDSFMKRLIEAKDELDRNAERIKKAEELLREVQSAGVSFEDERVAYVEIQVSKETLRAIDAFLERDEKDA